MENLGAFSLGALEMPIAVIATDLEGRITYWNRHATTMYGWRAEEVVGRPITEVTPAEPMHELTEDIMERLRAGVPWGGQFTVKDRLGRQFEIFILDAPIIKDGKVIGLVGFSLPVAESLLMNAEAMRTLTDREIQIAEMTARGLTSSRIAEALQISRRTVESHRANVYRKLGIRSRTELLLLAIRSGFPAHL
jgi:PAS domain S-box-containing protein